MDLRAKLESLRAHLLNDLGYSRSEADPKKLAVAKADNAEPLEVFLEWLGRQPEARDFLAREGLEWGRAPERQVTLEAVTDGQGPVMLRVQRGGRYANAVLVDVVGHMLKVHVEGTTKGMTTVVGLEAVSPVDRKRVEAAMKSHHGSAVKLAYDDELDQDEVSEEDDSECPPDGQR